MFRNDNATTVITETNTNSASSSEDLDQDHPMYDIKEDYDYASLYEEMEEDMSLFENVDDVLPSAGTHASRPFVSRESLVTFSLSNEAHGDGGLGECKTLGAGKATSSNVTTKVDGTSGSQTLMPSPRDGMSKNDLLTSPCQKCPATDDDAPSKIVARPLMSSDLSFPYRLFNMLNQAERYKFQDVISWVQKGTAFLIHNEDRFTDEVLSEFFPNMKKLKSFRRQLSAYSFTSIRGGPMEGAYYQKNFLRDDESKIINVERRKVMKRKNGKALTTNVASMTPQQSPSPIPSSTHNQPVGMRRPVAFFAVPRQITPHPLAPPRGQQASYPLLQSYPSIDASTLRGHRKATPALALPPAPSKDHSQTLCALFVNVPNSASHETPQESRTQKKTWFEVEMIHRPSSIRYPGVSDTRGQSSRSIRHSAAYDAPSSQSVPPRHDHDDRHHSVPHRHDHDHNRHRDYDPSGDDMEPIPFAPNFMWRPQHVQEGRREQKINETSCDSR